MYQKKIEVDGKTYTLTSNRSIIKTIYKIAPEMLSTRQEETNLTEDGQFKIGVDMMANLDIVFYDLIKVVHKDFTKETSDRILDKLDEEYGSMNVLNDILSFAMSSFTQGDQKVKSIWKD